VRAWPSTSTRTFLKPFLLPSLTSRLSPAGIEKDTPEPARIEALANAYAGLGRTRPAMVANLSAMVLNVAVSVTLSQGIMDSGYRVLVQEVALHEQLQHGDQGGRARVAITGHCGLSPSCVCAGMF
jgi:hypothetical protein